MTLSRPASKDQPRGPTPGLDQAAATPSLIIITGADEAYFPWMIETLESISHARIDRPYALGVLDCGLTPAQRAALETYDVTVVRPDWDLDVPLHLRHTEGDLGRVSRPMLRKYFPGYEMYFWIDADAWIQDGSCIETYASLAERKGMAIVREQEKAYKFQFLVFKWSLGNFYLNYGPIKAAYLHWLCPPINNGVMALRADAPHWDRWCAHYRRTIHRSKKLYNQIPLAAAIHLERLEVGYLKGQHNWICSRGQPYWNEESGKLCMPYPPYEPLTVVHLAGPDKDRLYRLRTVQGNTVEMSLSYAGWRASRPEGCQTDPGMIAAE